MLRWKSEALLRVALRMASGQVRLGMEWLLALMLSVRGWVCPWWLA